MDTQELEARLTKEDIDKLPVTSGTLFNKVGDITVGFDTRGRKWRIGYADGARCKKPCR